MKNFILLRLENFHHFINLIYHFMKKFFTFILATLLSINVFAQCPLSTAVDFTATDCHGTASASVEISDITTTNTTVTATFTPNEDCASYYYMIGTEAEMAMWVQMMQTPLEQLVMQWGIQATGVVTYTWTDQAPATEYTIYVVPVNADSTLGEMVTAKATTTTAGGTGISEIEMTVEVLSETEVKTFTTPNDQTAEYHYGLIEKAYYEEIGEEGLIQIIQEDMYPYYEYSEWTWINLIPETEYYGFAQGKNANGEWGTITLVPFVTTPAPGTDVKDVNELSFNIFPNPAKDLVKIEGNGLKTIEIFNVTGQSVVKQEVSGNEAVISIENLESGVYFVKVNGTKTQKLVVR